MFVVIWEYDVHEGSQAAFEALYGSDGEWVALFREYDGYAGTQLLRAIGHPNRFMTIDHWSSPEAYAAFLTASKPRYEQIDARGDALTIAERRIGAYTTAP